MVERSRWKEERERERKRDVVTLSNGLKTTNAQNMCEELRDFKLCLLAQLDQTTVIDA